MATWKVIWSRGDETVVSRGCDICTPVGGAWTLTRTMCARVVPPPDLCVVEEGWGCVAAVLGLRGAEGGAAGGGAQRGQSHRV